MNLVGRGAVVGGVALTVGAVATVLRRRRLPSAVAVAPSGEALADAATDPAFVGHPSRSTIRAVMVLRCVSAVTDFVGLDIGTQIAPLIASKRPPSRLLSGLEVRREDIDGWPVYVLRPPGGSGKHVVALHGGAYVVQPTISHWSAYATLARRTRATVIVPIYPLATTPQGRAATVIPTMADLISTQIERHGAENVAVYGDSAGGGIALAVTQLMTSKRQAVPSRMVLISPWLDVTMTNPAIASIDDPVLRRKSLTKAGRQWAGHLSCTHPWVSPIHGPLAGLPSTAIYCGDLDLLAADVLLLQAKAQTAPCDFTFILRHGAIHDWAMGGVFASPESAVVQPDIYRQLGLTD